MELKNILFVAASPRYGGTEKHLLDLIRRLGGADALISIACTGEDVFSSRFDEALTGRVRLEVVRELNSFRDWVRFFRSHRPDIVVLVKSWAWCFPWYTLLAARVAGIRRRYVIAHLPPSRIDSSLAGPLTRLRYMVSHRRLGVSCTATICVSDFIRRCLVDDCLFPARSTLVVRNGVSLSAFYPDETSRSAVRRHLGIPDRSVCLICVANLVEQKRVDVLLDAMARVLTSGYSCRCLIVGDGPLQPELRRQAEALRLTSHVLFEGSQKDVLPYLQAADAFVLTSSTEGLPLSVLEAMACGLPCIVTNVGGNAEAVMHQESGIVVPPASPEEVARAIVFMIQQPGRRAAMAEAARERARRYFDIEDCMARLRTHILA